MRLHYFLDYAELLIYILPSTLVTKFLVLKYRSCVLDVATLRNEVHVLSNCHFVLRKYYVTDMFL